MPSPNYQPKPIDTEGIVLPPELAALTERLSENAHELWAKERMAQGWIPGSKRDDAAKTHPGLVKYDALLDSEKKFDRETAMGTLKAMLALGYRIEPPSVPVTAPAGDERDALETWSSQLESRFTAATGAGSRDWTFDMNDEPEIAQIPAGHLQVARDALQEIQQNVFPEWLEADSAALRLQFRHRWIAAVAIWPGIAAILCAILQLLLEPLLPAGSTILTSVASLEVVSLSLAAGAVALGFFAHLHHGWLSQRQRAERLRILKFEALSWPELWCDFGAWKVRLKERIDLLNKLTTKDAHAWAKEKDTVRPDLPEPPDCTIPANDLRALTELYRVKRLQFQQSYFEFQAVRAGRRSWIVDYKIGLCILTVSFAIVLLHALHFLPRGRSWEMIAIGLAALLPVIGFGLRAWLAAFEAPRSRNLFRAKARALDAYVARNREDAAAPRRALHHIAYGEHFFANEHREWCRLQLEAEWFV